MRWKLIILSSLIISFVSAGAWCALTTLVFHTALFLPGNWIYLQVLGLILIVTVLGIYIYRHTSQRRKTQVFLAITLVIISTSAFLFCMQRLINLFFKA